MQLLRTYRGRPRGALLLAPALACVACVAGTPIEAPKLTRSPLPQAEPEPYRLHVGDLVAVKFWANAELDEEVRIRPDGAISLPFVDEVQAAGRTPAELDDFLTELYAAELTKPEITVIVREIRGQLVYVAGEVAEPGSIELDGGPITLLQAIQEAGYFLHTARRREVLLLRSISKDEWIARQIDMLPIISGKSPSADVWLQASDIVVVPRTKITSLNLFLEQYLYELLPVDLYASIRLIEDRGGSNP